MTLLPALVAPDVLASRLGDPRLVVLDSTVELVRPDGGGPYRPVPRSDSFAQAHLPGAQFADLVSVLGREVDGRPFGIPSIEDARAALAVLGVTASSHVVVYAQGSTMWATRLWWLLRYWGFDSVSVLDGGLTTWNLLGLPVETQTDAGRVGGANRAIHGGGELALLAEQPRYLATLADVLEVSETGSTCLVNTLSPEVFRGEGVTSYSRPGRIPGSVNSPARSLLDEESQRFLPLAVLEERLALLLDDPRPWPVVHCGGGISATVVVFALALLGRDDVRLYDGSLAEWSADPSLPLVGEAL